MKGNMDTPKKKKKKRAAVRRDPYSRALDTASARLERAISEREKCKEKLASLDQEIPYLEGIIRTLNPPQETEEQRLSRNIYENGKGVPYVPPHLKRFLHRNAPVVAPTQAPPAPQEIESEDDTLRDDLLPQGEDLT